MQPSSGQSPATQETTLGADIRYAARYYLGNRRSLIISILALAAMGAWLNWQWLVTVGLAPLLISLLPCAVMCALGICMHRGGNNHCAAKAPDQTAKKPDN
ncbi:MAG: hypothetical protein KDK05_01570 [Candidatus Competibacteraceae bacterium]|jgi:hypothetical protein|nr:hypothetical protein [Candidatus Competibacteraceae bacterium]